MRLAFIFLIVAWPPRIGLAKQPIGSTIPVLPTDSQEDILRKAAHVVPTPRQMDYHRREFIGFIHFGPNTFTGLEWGNGKEDPTLFQPEQLDTDQWCAALKAAGITAVVLTVKHHDGYCLWQTRYEDHQSVKKSPWLQGQGDVLRELSQSCQKLGLKLGVYLSPADLYQIESSVGLYGNGSKSRMSTIPTSQEAFHSDPILARQVANDLPKFKFEVDDYNRYFLNQLYELLTEYGPVHEVWFDGAHPKRKGNQQYAYQHWYHLIRKLAPQAVIFGKGPDIRWCGNESGRTRETEWNAIPLEVSPEKCDWPDLTDADLGSRAKLAQAKFLYYLPAETNTSIRHGWFWRNDDEQEVRSPDDVFDIYERSVGGNSVFMLNVPPNHKGQFSARDVACLQEVGRRIRATYDQPSAKWSRQSRTSPTIWEGFFNQPTTLNRFVVQEDIAHSGQRVASHVVEALLEGEYREISRGTTIGYKKIHRFPEVTTTGIRVRVLDNRAEPSLVGFSAHHYIEPPRPVTIERNRQGIVALSVGRNHRFTWKTRKPFQPPSASATQILYTLDGSLPESGSSRYEEPFSFPEGGTIKARTLSGGELGPVNIMTLGIQPTGWKVSASSEHESHKAAQAIDGDPLTFWHTPWESDHPVHPHSITLELDRERILAGFTYLPRQDKRVPDSMVERWRVEVSTDAKHWKVVAENEFGNLLNDPAKRRFDFEKPVSARLFRFISLRGVQDKPYAGAAEIELLGP